MKIITKILATAFVLLLVARFIPGIVVEGLYVAIVAAIVLGILNILVKPVLVLLTLPINILTLGLFTFFINASLFWFAATFIEGFSVGSFSHAFVGSLIVTATSYLLNRYL
jgi:putative membrane protein